MDQKQGISQRASPGGSSAGGGDEGRIRAIASSYTKWHERSRRLNHCSNAEAEVGFVGSLIRRLAPTPSPDAGKAFGGRRLRTLMRGRVFVGPEGTRLTRRARPDPALKTPQ